MLTIPTTKTFTVNISNIPSDLSITFPEKAWKELLKISPEPGASFAIEQQAADSIIVRKALSNEYSSRLHDQRPNGSRKMMWGKSNSEKRKVFSVLPTFGSTSYSMIVLQEEKRIKFLPTEELQPYHPKLSSKRTRKGTSIMNEPAKTTEEQFGSFKNFFSIIDTLNEYRQHYEAEFTIVEGGFIEGNILVGKGRGKGKRK